MASYIMRTDTKCKTCGTMTPYFPQCLACSFLDPLPFVEIETPKSKLRKVKARKIHTKEKCNAGI